MASDRKVYNIGGTLWVQRELTYGEDIALKGVLKVISDRFANGQATLGDLIDVAFDGETVAGLLRVVLKPYEPTPIHKAYNAIRAKIGRVDRGNIISIMPNSQLAVVLADFFMLNTRWIGSLPSMPNITGSNSKA